MTQTTSRPIETKTLEAPGATITYDVRRADGTAEPPLMVIGSPMARRGVRDPRRPTSRTGR